MLTVQVERKSARIFFPLTRLSQGDGFTIQMGPLRKGPCLYGNLAPVCTETFDGSLVVKFVPRRP